MNNFEAADWNKQSGTDNLNQKRQEKALREFKQVLEDLVFMLRSASGMETVYMYWVNRSRQQFVMETKSTVLNNVMFKDRVNFDQHFLNEYKDLSEPTAAEVGKDIPAAALNHYYHEVPVRYVTLLPFINNGETVAITVLESSKHHLRDTKRDVIFAYISALRNVLNTYLEISDLQGQQDEWVNYEECVAQLYKRCHRAEMIKNLINLIEGFLNEGGVSFVTRGKDGWCNVMNSESAVDSPRVGLPMEERSLADEAAEKGEPEFAIHFNENPKRLSPRELKTRGATLAIPLLMEDRRQGVILAYDANPLIFKESTKHKIINLVRIAGLKIQANATTLDIDGPIFLNEYGAFLPDVWELMIHSELARLKHGTQGCQSCFGLITLDNLPELRTKLRLEELNQMQRSLISAFNPIQYGYPGMLGYHSDYIYSFFIQTNDRQGIRSWLQALKKKFNKPLELSGGKSIKTGIKVGFVTLEERFDDTYQLLNEAKAELSQAVNSTQNEVV